MSGSAMPPLACTERIPILGFRRETWINLRPQRGPARGPVACDQSDSTDVLWLGSESSHGMARRLGFKSSGNMTCNAILT